MKSKWLSLNVQRHSSPKSFKDQVALVIASLMVAVCCLSACGTANRVCVLLGVPVALKPEDFGGDWIGFIDSDFGLYRLELHTNGAGVMTALFADNSMNSYRVTDWHVVSNNLAFCMFENSVAANSPLRLECAMHNNQLLGLLYGDGWKEEITFKRRQLLESRLKRIMQE